MAVDQIDALLKAEEDKLFADLGIERTEFLRERQFHGHKDVETISEIYDRDEKNAVFTHSLKQGVLKQIQNSPIKNKLPKDIGLWMQDHQGF